MYIISRCELRSDTKKAWEERQYLQADYSFGAKESATQITTAKLCLQILEGLERRDKRGKYIFSYERKV